MNNEELKRILGAMILDTYKKECDELMPFLDAIICSIDDICEKHGIPIALDEIVSTLCSVLPLIHDEYCNE